ncbi:type III-B CRISPR-associated protein Cas10/Cmr2 [Nodosilinea sp. P-1105]|uniref:type III-B CRISPR-associated protein Cas10/Cmr2 n=1 Tax=Nodosilinea sp. P-1105 TaxID=2546229 RepID=UPI003241D38C
MSKAFWQAKIWGLLHGLALFPSSDGSNPLSEHCTSAGEIAVGSDRTVLGLIPEPDDPAKTAEVRHLLSGAQLPLNATGEDMQGLRSHITTAICTHSPLAVMEPPEQASVEELQQQFWWLWRCLPGIVTQADTAQLLTPANSILPDVSLWSQASMTAAMAGTLAGYSDSVNANGEQRPYLTVFSFTPVQELIKASRKMRDFWAGSWVLHYLSAKVCWKLAQKYGPDCLVYPSLFQQPLIDHWLLEKWPEFYSAIAPPTPQKLLTAGFPNVIVLLLPQEKVNGAMQMARQTLHEEWLNLGTEVFTELHDERHWMRDLKPQNRTWEGWLKAQWQPYWTALPVGATTVELHSCLDQAGVVSSEWKNQQNWACNLKVQTNGRDRKAEGLFSSPEAELLKAIAQSQKEHPIRVNVGSWWPYTFDQLRFSLNAVKSARVWKLPTAFGPRSTISGFGPVVYPKDQQRRITETDASQFWGNQWEADLGDAASSEQRQKQAGLFDGREQLNATETLKRGLHRILDNLNLVAEGDVEDAIAAAYPDLTAGVAGYLKTYQDHGQDKADGQGSRKQHFIQLCNAIVQEHPWAEDVAKAMRGKWGIPWEDSKNDPKKYHSRLLNPGWLVEDAATTELNNLRQALKTALQSDANDKAQIDSLRRQITELKAQYREKIRDLIADYYPNNNPADWYVLAAGDGDGMRHWLKGKPLGPYQDYMPDHQNLPQETQAALQGIKTQVKKRMGPSTHVALSRALLDFSNQLVPYLTERRYAGRLIYSGGDDVLAYTNLWEWDQWLWDIRQCFRGADDPNHEFESTGDYWQRKPTSETPKPHVPDRPLFTLGQKATVSFGLVIAHNSVPLAIALEHLWETEAEAKKHYCATAKPEKAKDATQVRVIYANGNTLKATSKFAAFNHWQALLPPAGDPNPKLTSALFEQAAQVWSQHPAPTKAAIHAWTQVFCSRRDLFGNDDEAREGFRYRLEQFLQSLWETTPEKEQLREIQNWLKLAAFTIRTRSIAIRTPGERP